MTATNPNNKFSNNIFSCLLATLFSFTNFCCSAQTFTDVTRSANLDLIHQTSQNVVLFDDAELNTINHVNSLNNTTHLMSTWLTGGVAAGDYDGDGWDDLYVIGGDLGQSKLYRNLGNGTFEDVTSSVGMSTVSGRIAGAVFADFDGDNDLDLFLGGILEESPRLMRNDINTTGVFTDVFSTAFPGYDVEFAPNAFGASFGDINNDGCLDIYIPHSLTPHGPSPRLKTTDGSSQHLWKNDCNGQFIDISVSSQISLLYDDPNVIYGVKDQSFTGNFTDINNDGYQDILVTGDIRTSLVLINQGNETFTNMTDRKIINDLDAMGSAVGDIRNDGVIDWFSSNIGSPSNGNKIYYGQGNGHFINGSMNSGLTEGHWGWGSCFIDVNADQKIDVFHVNGFYFSNNPNPASNSGHFFDTPAALFTANGDGTFSESASKFGIDDINEGRGVSCFDYDKDGDLDIAISNHKGPFKLYRNDIIKKGINFLNVRLIGFEGNPQGIGAKVIVQSHNPNEEGFLLKEIYSGNNFVSSNPASAHFILGQWEGPFSVSVQWLDKQQKVTKNIQKNQFLTINASDRYIFKSNFEPQ